MLPRQKVEGEQSQKPDITLEEQTQQQLQINRQEYNLNQAEKIDLHTANAIADNLIILKQWFEDKIEPNWNELQTILSDEVNLSQNMEKILRLRRSINNEIIQGKTFLENFNRLIFSWKPKFSTNNLNILTLKSFAEKLYLKPGEDFHISYELENCIQKFKIRVRNFETRLKNYISEILGNRKKPKGN